MKDVKVSLVEKNVVGFTFIEKTNTWILNDAFLSGLKKRWAKNGVTDLTQACRLFFFHETLHFSKKGYSLTGAISDGIGQFPKVIEEANYQDDGWA